jgi:vanillate/4-hydroxybenzoate decarboxylase subunit C
VNFADLRTFLDALADEGQLLTISDPVMPEPDLGAAVRGAQQPWEGMAAIEFTNVVGHRSARIAKHGSPLDLRHARTSRIWRRTTPYLRPAR